MSQNPPKNPDYPEVTSHHLKSNIAAYLRALEEGRYKGIVVKRYNAPVGLLMLHPEAKQREYARAAAITARAEAEDKALKTPISGPTFENGLKPNKKTPRHH